MVVGFIRVPGGSLGWGLESSGTFGFAYIHSGGSSGGRVHSGSHGFIQARLGVVGFISVPVGSIRSATCLAVYSGLRGFTRAFLVVVGCIWVRVGRALALSGSFGFGWVQSGAPKSHRVPVRSLRIIQARLGDVGFSVVRLGSLRHA